MTMKNISHHLPELLVALKTHGSIPKEVHDFVDFCYDNVPDMNSQCLQDIWVLFEYHKKQNGYFVEFGATDGIKISNTLSLEKYGWTGILAEPVPEYFKQLVVNRPNANCTDLCITDKSGETVSFVVDNALDLSSQAMCYTRNDVKQLISAKTITLVDLLDMFKAPKTIDYLSIDTEGSEYDILGCFFNEPRGYQIGCITVEHNYTPFRQKIANLLSANGFAHELPIISSWDDFYINQKVVNG